MFRIKYCREAVLKLLYQVDVLGLKDECAEELLQQNMGFLTGLNKREKSFILQVTQKILDEKEGIDRLISKHLIGWKLERLMAVDRTLLRLGVGESFFNDQKAIIIDDVIRIAKKYGGEDSYKIINAVLDKVIE
jgi:N utilization substance protein B